MVQYLQIVDIGGSAYGTPIQGKLVVFIGTPQNCTRHSARDALYTVGGITDNRITIFVNYVVAFAGAENTKIFRSAMELAQVGALSIRSEELFLAILAGEGNPPEKPKRDGTVVVIPPKDPEAEAREREEAMEMILNRKRMNNLAQYGVPTENGRVKVDLRTLDKVAQLKKMFEEQE